MNGGLDTSTTSVFEALPLLAVEVAALRLQTYPINWMSPSPPHPSEKLLRNCIDRGVYSLKLVDTEKVCHVACPPAELSSDVREESILDFCFAPRSIRSAAVWQLSWVHLSPEFISRFTQASEACDSDHKVKLILRGANVCQQDLSQFRTYDPCGRYPFGTSIWTNVGRYVVRMVRILRTGFFFAHRSTFPVEEWPDDNEGLLQSEFDDWVFVRPTAI